MQFWFSDSRQDSDTLHELRLLPHVLYNMDDGSMLWSRFSELFSKLLRSQELFEGKPVSATIANQRCALLRTASEYVNDISSIDVQQSILCESDPVQPDIFCAPVLELAEHVFDQGIFSPQADVMKSDTDNMAFELTNPDDWHVKLRNLPFKQYIYF